MIAILSPAKTLDFETPAPETPVPTQPQYLGQSGKLIGVLQKRSVKQLGELMGISENLAGLNRQRFLDWSLPFTQDNAKPAVLAFKGDVYLGLQAETLDTKQLDYAQGHLRILSGLYGLLRPMDLIQPYRLEMGTGLKVGHKKNLYEFWGDELRKRLVGELEADSSPVLVNLASNEYSDAAKLKKFPNRVISPVFHDEKNGKYKMISFFAKKARGLMARYLIQNEISDPAGLLAFDLEGYAYYEDASTPDKPVFRRPEDWK